MSENQQAVRTGSVQSRNMKMILVLIMAVLLFGGPYVVYVLVNILKIGYLVSTVCGFAMVIVGLILMWYLIKNKIVT